MEIKKYYLDRLIVLEEQLKNAKKKLNIILNDTNIYAFYNNLLANLLIFGHHQLKEF